MTDPRWLEILKASGGQAAAGAGACAGLLLAAHWGWIPALDAWVVQSATFGLVLFALLAFVGFFGAVNKFFLSGLGSYTVCSLRRERNAVENYIPHMTERERYIIAYLLHRNQKMFTCASDGGHAATLISQGIIVRALRPGQVFRQDDMPVAVPDHVWDVLIKAKDKFPYKEPRHGETEPYPWRVRRW